MWARVIESGHLHSVLVGVNQGNISREQHPSKEDVLFEPETNSGRLPQGINQGSAKDDHCKVVYSAKHEIIKIFLEMN